MTTGTAVWSHMCWFVLEAVIVMVCVTGCDSDGLCHRLW